MNRADGDDIRHGLGRNQRELERRGIIVVQLDESRSLDAIASSGDLAGVGHGGIVAEVERGLSPPSPFSGEPVRRPGRNALDGSTRSEMILNLPIWDA